MKQHALLSLTISTFLSLTPSLPTLASAAEAEKDSVSREVVTPQTRVTAPANWHSFSEFLEHVDLHVGEMVERGCKAEDNERPGSIPEDHFTSAMAASLVFGGLLFGIGGTTNSTTVVGAGFCVGVGTIVVAVVEVFWKRILFCNISIQFLDSKKKEIVEIYEIRDVRKGKDLQAVRAVLAKHGLKDSPIVRPGP
jgi:hypothetical protein